MGLARAQPDELALAGPEHLDAGYVAAYDRKAAFDPSDDLMLVRNLGLGPGSTLVDVGAGTGTFVLAAAPYCRRVVAVDVSPGMLAKLEQKAAALAYTNVECVHAGFLSYEHQGAPADVVYSRHALHHLPDFWKGVALERIARTLNVGGVLRLRDIVFAFDPHEAPQLVEAWLGRASERSDAGWTRSELETHLRDEYSTFAWLLEPMLERVGFEISDRNYVGGRMYAEYVCVKRQRGG